MKKRWMGLLLGLTLGLTACGQGGGETPSPTAEETATATPEVELASEQVTELWGFPIDDTHDAFEVPTGGKLGTVLVTVEQEEDYCHLNFSVWKSDDLTTPIQVVTTESERHWEELEDINFDGYMDFMYLSSLGAANAYCSFWIWDEEQERFCKKEGLFNPIFDTETQMISSYTHYSAVSGVQSYWHWEDDELVMLRRIETYYPEFEGGTDTQLLTVEDRIDGELTEVYRETFGDPNDREIYEEAQKWDDLDYHGE